MGQRTQILVNIEVVDDNGIRSVERVSSLPMGWI